MFGHKPASVWFFDSSVHLEAFNRLLFLAESREALGWLTGPDGSGRSQVFARLRDELSSNGTAVVSLNVAGMDSDSALWAVASCFGIGGRPEQKRHDVLRLLTDELMGRMQCEVQTIVLLDDVHRSVDGCSMLVNLLLAVRAQSGNGLTVFAATDDAIPNGVPSDSLVRIGLTQLDSAEASDFIRTLVRRHDISMSVLDESAVRAIAEVSRGITARMIRICRLLHVVHETAPDLRITDNTVHAVLRELAPRVAA